ncbi:MAG: hypothetical protein ABSH25_17335 [Syntrophorhabdales bacterium]|jgi:hypothetical protein
MHEYHATVHVKEGIEIVFEAMVVAETKGQAHNKIRSYLIQNNKPELAGLGAMLDEIPMESTLEMPLIE